MVLCSLNTEVPPNVGSLGDKWLNQASVGPQFFFYAWTARFVTIESDLLALDWRFCGIHPPEKPWVLWRVCSALYS